MNLNEKLVELRKAKGLTQKELAEALNVTRQAISRWEVGTAAPSLDNLAFLSRLYGVPLDDFIQDGYTDVGTEEPSSGPAAPEPVPADVGRPRVPPALSLFLAVLILGVGILIGISLQKPNKEIYLYPSIPGEGITVGYLEGWLEKTPADIEAEKEYLEANGQKEYLGSGGQTKNYYSIYYPDSGLLKTFPNDSPENTPTAP